MKQLGTVSLFLLLAVAATTVSFAAPWNYPTPTPYPTYDSFYSRLERPLVNAQTDLRFHRVSLALARLWRADRMLAPRPSAIDRQLSRSLRRTISHIQSHQVAYAQSMLSGIIRTVRDQAHGGGWSGVDHYDEDRNHREWIRDIRDIINTIQDGNLYMAKRDLRTLTIDVRQDGANTNFNRDITRRLQYIVMLLGDTYGDVWHVTNSLRQLSQHLRQSIGQPHSYR